MANTSVFIPVITPVTTDASLTGDGTLGSPLAVVSGGIVAPGADTQVVFNDGAVLGADAGLTWDNSGKTLTVVQGSSHTTIDRGIQTNDHDDYAISISANAFNIGNGSDAIAIETKSRSDAASDRLIGINIRTNVLGPTFSANTNYGILIDDQAVAGATNYAIYTGSGDVSVGDDLTIRSGNLSAVGSANVFVVPTADPHVVGALWNDTGTLKVSAG